MRHIVLALGAIGLAGAPAHKAPPAPAVVSVAWLAQHSHDAGIVILQMGPPPMYDSAHIAGARSFRSVDPRGMEVGMDELMSTLPTSEQLQSGIEAAGISDNSHVIVSFEGKGIPAATRTIFMLHYAGFDNVSLLDGGMVAWRAAGLPVTREVPAAVQGHVTVHLRPEIAAAWEYVKAHAIGPKTRLIDARDAEYYTGKGGEGMSPGHIPGAVSLPYSSLVDERGLLLPREQLATMISAAGVQPGDTVVAYCHVGMQATVVVLAAQMTGHPARLYVGSFHDWTAHKQPTEGGK